MRTPWQEMWGFGRGPAGRLAPQTRILTGGILFAAGLTAPAGSVSGVLLIAALTLGWIAACGMPLRAARSFAVLGLAMFLPYFLLVSLILKDPALGREGTGLIRGFSAPWDVFVHGLAGLFLAAATATALSASGLRSGLLALPIPRIVSSILVQIVQQAGELAAETGRMAAALAVRGGTGKLRAAWRALTSLPRVWLPRLIRRADRLAAAMELRGYVEADLRFFGRDKAGAADAAAIAAALAIAGLASALRWGRAG